MDTIGSQHYSGVFLTQGLPVYFQLVWYCVIGLLSTMWLRFQSFTLLHTRMEGLAEASNMSNNANLSQVLNYSGNGGQSC